MRQNAGHSLGTLKAVRLVGPGAEYLADEEPIDVFIDDGLIVDIAPTGALPERGAVLDAEGQWAVPGLWDNHVHSVQWALAAERVSLWDAESAHHAAALIGHAAPLLDGRRIGTGYRDALWADEPSLAVLDAATGSVPTYLINADVHSVWLNSAALARERLTSEDGVLREQAAFDVSARLNAVDAGSADVAVSAAGRRAAARGITGIVDFDMAWNAEAWQRRAVTGFAAHRVEFATYPVDLDRAIAAGLRTGDLLDGTGGLVRVGPLKIISDGSLGTRTAACSHAYTGEGANTGALSVPDDVLLELFIRATGSGLAVAAHAIGDRAAAAVLDAFAVTGATGTVEHAQLLRRADLLRIARLGLAASIQPMHAVDDRDMADLLWGTQTALAYPMRSLREAGVPLRFGSDAPVAHLDPWHAIAAAVHRTDDDRPAWHVEEALTVDEAIDASVRTAIRPGAVADVVVCGADPRTADRVLLRDMPVHATVLSGRLTHLA